jgi:catechol 2,3-dioxygenase-like lactoylglutathione lyase family enzyme
MFDHVTLCASDARASRRFYETVIGPADGWREFRLAPARQAAAVTRGLHIGFVTRSRAEVDAFWRAGVAAGYQSDGEPGPRPIYSPDYYGAFLLDPDGNSTEAVHHGRERSGPGLIDHLWIRVADLAATRRFWDEIAPVLGLTIYGERPERFHVGAHDRSFALVSDGRPITKNASLAFPVAVGTALGALGALADGVHDPDGNRIAAAAAR